MASNQNTYVLTEDDLSYWEDEDPPEIRAAQNPDSRVLLALIDHAPVTSRRKYSSNAFIPGHVGRLLETPLTAAIKAQLPDTVRTLLSRGAHPDGYPLNAMSEYASIFLRFRDQCSLIVAPREEVLKHIPTSQTVPLIASEIEARSKSICLLERSGLCSPKFLRRRRGHVGSRGCLQARVYGDIGDDSIFVTWYFLLDRRADRHSGTSNAFFPLSL